MDKHALKAKLYFEHPDESPELVGSPPYTIHPPTRLSATAEWLRFRDRTLLPMIAESPNDPNLPRYLAQVDKVLKWRAAIAPRRRFWKAD